MNRKLVLHEEVAYFIGIVLLAFGTSLSARANFGMSMVVAPAYLVHLKVSDFLPWFSFGVAEYTLQAILLIILTIVVRKFKKGYVFSFVTALFYGVVLDIAMKVVALLPGQSFVARIIFFVAGVLFCAIGIAFLFHTYIAPEAYELIVKEIAADYKKEISKVKTVYDCISCLVGLILSFAFFGMWQFVGVSYGTLICALCNGFLIGRFSKVIDKFFTTKRNEKLYKIFS